MAGSLSSTLTLANSTALGLALTGMNTVEGERQPAGASLASPSSRSSPPVSLHRCKKPRDGLAASAAAGMGQQTGNGGCRQLAM